MIRNFIFVDDGIWQWRSPQKRTNIVAPPSPVAMITPNGTIQFLIFFYTRFFSRKKNVNIFSGVGFYFSIIYISDKIIVNLYHCKRGEGDHCSLCSWTSHCQKPKWIHVFFKYFIIFSYSRRKLIVRTDDSIFFVKNNADASLGTRNMLRCT